MTLESLCYITLLGVPPKGQPNNVIPGMRLESVGYTTLLGVPHKMWSNNAIAGMTLEFVCLLEMSHSEDECDCWEHTVQYIE